MNGTVIEPRTINSISQDEWLRLKELSLPEGFLDFMANWKSNLIPNETDIEKFLLSDKLNRFDWHNPLISIATKNDSIIGWAISVKDCESSDWIGSVFVSTEDRNKGVGSQLVLNVIQTTPNTETIFHGRVYVKLELLQKAGFEKTNDRLVGMYSIFRPIKIEDKFVFY